MNKLLTLIIILFSINVLGQVNPTQQAQPIVAEGKLLYKLEMASWYGTDLFLEAYKTSEKVGGYFSYIDKDAVTCVFFSTAEKPKIIGAISFDSTYNTTTAKIDLNERNFTSGENDLYIIREIALAEINSDTLFKKYKNTSLNLIPLISKNEKKVYVLTGPKDNGVVIFGNDYLLSFSSDNKLTLKKQLHQNLIPVYFGQKEEEGKEIIGAMHMHLPESGEFITATDICTLMLYEKFAKWKTHNVVSEKYLNIWNCEDDRLTVIPRHTGEKGKQK